MAKATRGGVTLELTSAEAQALHALLGGMNESECFENETNDIFDALEALGVESDAYELQWDKTDSGGVKIARAK